MSLPNQPELVRDSQNNYKTTKINSTKLCYNVNMKEKIIEFWKKNEMKIVLLAGLVLVALISFQGGYLKGKAQKDSPLVIEKTASCPASSEDQPSQPKTETSASNLQVNNNPTTSENKNCAFVGSKNSNKYHLPTCRWAKNIKPENLVCFASAEAALGKGYQPDKNCIK
jgi:hypothetical protein